MNQDDHITWMREKLAMYEKELTQAQEKVQRLAPVVGHLRGAIAALLSVQGDNKTGRLFEDSPTRNPPSMPNFGALIPQAHVQGGESAMPPRRTKSDETLIEAIRKVLDASSGALHADEITDMIFDWKTTEQKRRAKHSVVAELYRGMPNGWWEKLGGNRFVSSKRIKGKEGARAKQ